MFLKTDGIVLRQVDYADYDRLLTVLTRDFGKMTLRARGVRRRTSPLKASCQLLVYSEFTIFENRGFHTVNEAVPKTLFSALRQDVELLALASYFAELSEILSQEDCPDSALLSLLLNGLYALSNLQKPQALVKAALELRIACFAGYAPELSACAVCGNPKPDRFLLLSGALQCAGCQSGDARGLRMPVGQGTLTAMRHITSCEPGKLVSFTLSEMSMKELSDLAEAYLATQLERGFYTLDFYKSLKQT